MIEKALRQSLPYINAHRGKLFVIYIDSETIAGENLKQHINDITLLNSLGVKIVVVFGARLQIDEYCALNQIKCSFFQGSRITDTLTLDKVKTVVGKTRVYLESLFAQGLPYSSGFGFHSHCISGNFVVAQPLGVLNGIDHEYTGKVRQIESSAIKDQLKQNNIVLLSALGISLTGDIFNCKAEEVATAAASQLKADKLIIFSDLKHHPELKQEIQLTQLNHLLLENTDTDLAVKLAIAKKSISKVNRIHLIEKEQDGALLTELFTRDGSGVMITGASYDELRKAKGSDIQGILNIIQPLEEQGVLVARSQEQLEFELQHFHVIERDGLIIACVALIPYIEDKIAELTCLAVHQDYQNKGYGNRLLLQMENFALKQALIEIFVLTTQTADWFKERHFEEGELKVLPKIKQTYMDKQRNAKVFIKKLNL